ncbi:MAG TPA: NAD(P)/FAD-dependent oxidoreductase [Xanthomonadaceae bacterium]|nr:NAD(P)/FAD-dependent oxidoreductase [Xanthomonadaceae bacterium]
MTSTSDPHAIIPHVLILGGGFGGLWATRALATAPVRITLVDRTNHHLFQPLLYQVATAGLSAPDIAAPLRHILHRQRNVTVMLGEARGIDLVARHVTLEHGAALTPPMAPPVVTPSPAEGRGTAGLQRDEILMDYDYLIIATGTTHAYFGHDEWATHAPGLKTLEDALAIRRRVLTAFEAAEREDDAAARAAWMNFVVIGGGPTGVELAGTLAEIARHTLPREFRRCDPRTAQIHLLEAGPRVLAAMPESLSQSARKQLERLGVDVHTGQAVTAIDAQGVSLGATRIESRCVLWAAGVAASPLGRQLGVALDRAGRVSVQPDLSIEGHPEVFVVGDLARVIQANGQQVPGVAPAAKQMGAHVAAVVRARLQSKPAKPFRYRDYGNLATIGRMAAVVDLGRIRFSGLMAWWFWLAAHIFFLIGFRNRLVVMLDWAWSYWSYQRNARIIVGSDPPASNHDAF